MSACVLFIGILVNSAPLWQPAAVCFAVFFSIGIAAIPALKNYQYTAWIITAVIAAMIYPGAFSRWGNADLRNKWLILIVVQMVMFGMGIQMSIRDFSSVATTGKGVLIGLACHSAVLQAHFKGDCPRGVFVEFE